MPWQEECKKTGHMTVELKRWPAAQDPRLAHCSILFYFFNQKNSSEVVTNRGRIDNQAKINSFSYEKGGEVVERHLRSLAALC